MCLSITIYLCSIIIIFCLFIFFFFFNDTATTEIYTLSLHDALPILYSVGDESGADAVAGDIADQYIQVFFFEWSDQAEVAADSVRWLIESVGAQASPEDGFWCQALLHSGRQH